ncbi:hypothetical protein C2845_PM02G16440 [Panicum miliaceum]|uniref:Uncharacterized protein n=1 Tax=Panicum miliaceum TaxID=4540 RepID=A0A3L6S5D9_PANMI|nr:hypothetical protein C2845_PM02G16440 [Panicum miliaceum]
MRKSPAPPTESTTQKKSTAAASSSSQDKSPIERKSKRPSFTRKEQTNLTGRAPTNTSPELPWRTKSFAAASPKLTPDPPPSTSEKVRKHFICRFSGSATVGTLSSIANDGDEQT